MAFSRVKKKITQKGKTFFLIVIESWRSLQKNLIRWILELFSELKFYSYKNIKSNKLKFLCIFHWYNSTH